LSEKPTKIEIVMSEEVKKTFDDLGKRLQGTNERIENLRKELLCDDCPESIVYRLKRLEQADEGEVDEHGCKVGQEKWDGEKCVPVTNEERIENLRKEIFDEESEDSIINRLKRLEQETDEHGCKVGQEKWDGEKCVALTDEEREALRVAQEALSPKEGETREQFMSRCMGAGNTMEQCAANWKEPGEGQGGERQETASFGKDGDGAGEKPLRPEDAKVVASIKRRTR